MIVNRLVIFLSQVIKHQKRLEVFVIPYTHSFNQWGRSLLLLGMFLCWRFRWVSKSLF